jgi:hypothetical protein
MIPIHQRDSYITLDANVIIEKFNHIYTNFKKKNRLSFWRRSSTDFALLNKLKSLISLQPFINRYELGKIISLLGNLLTLNDTDKHSGTSSSVPLFYRLADEKQLEEWSIIIFTDYINTFDSLNIGDVGIQDPGLIKSLAHLLEELCQLYSQHNSFTIHEDSNFCLADYNQTQLYDSAHFSNLIQETLLDSLPDQASTEADILRKNVLFNNQIIAPYSDDPDQVSSEIKIAIENFTAEPGALSSSDKLTKSLAKKIHVFGGQYLFGVLMNEFFDTVMLKNKETSNMLQPSSANRGLINWCSKEGKIYAEVVMHIFTFKSVPIDETAYQPSENAYYGLSADQKALMMLQPEAIRSHAQTHKPALIITAVVNIEELSNTDDLSLKIASFQVNSPIPELFQVKGSLHQSSFAPPRP